MAEVKGQIPDTLWDPHMQDATRASQGQSKQCQHTTPEECQQPVAEQEHCLY